MSKGRKKEKKRKREREINNLVFEIIHQHFLSWVEYLGKIILHSGKRKGKKLEGGKGKGLIFGSKFNPHFWEQKEKEKENLLNNNIDKGFL